MSTVKLYVPDGPIVNERAVTPALNSSQKNTVKKLNNDLLYETMMSVEQLRIHALSRYRGVFGVISVILAFIAGVCLYFHVPYEPAAALFFATLGIFVIFSMKLADAK
jgi:hypothetical protein